MTHLDDVEKTRTMDPDNMYRRIYELPEQMAEALEIAADWRVDADHVVHIANVVAVGMGGSAIGGDLTRTLLTPELQIPFQVCRHYRLPQYVGKHTLVIASSYSGNTEETLAAVEDAFKRDAKVVAITTGGKLGQVAEDKGVPIAKIPSGLQPRAAIGYSFVPVLFLFEKLGLVSNTAARVTQTVARLKSLRDKYAVEEPTPTNPAKRLAFRMHGRIPIVYSGPTFTDVVGVRWKGQICENSKNMAFANQYSEFNHNELVGWSDLVSGRREHLVVVQLKDVDDHPRVRRRMEIVRGIVEQKGLPVFEVESIGANPLERVFSLIQLGDFVSYYLAILNDVDPTPVEAIETLKSALARLK